MSAEGVRQDVRDAIAAPHAKYVRAMRDRDADAVAAHFTEDAILLPWNSDAKRGRTAIRDWFASWLPATIFDEFSVTTDDIAAAGDIAYRWELSLRSGVPRAAPPRPTPGVT